MCWNKKNLSISFLFFLEDVLQIICCCFLYFISGNFRVTRKNAEKNKGIIAKKLKMAASSPQQPITIKTLRL